MLTVTAAGPWLLWFLFPLWQGEVLGLGCFRAGVGLRLSLEDESVWGGLNRRCLPQAGLDHTFWTD